MSKNRRIRKPARLSPRPSKSLRKRERDSLVTIIKNVSDLVLIPIAALIGIFTFIVYLGESDEREMERSLLNLDAKVRAEEVLSSLPALNGDSPYSIAGGMETSRSTAYAVQALLLSNGSASLSTERANMFCDATSILTGNLSVASKSTDFIGCDARWLLVEQYLIKPEDDPDELTVSLASSTWVDSALMISTRPVRERSALVDIRNATIRRSSIVVDEDDRIQIKDSSLQAFKLEYRSESQKNVLDFVTRRNVTLPTTSIDELTENFCVRNTNNDSKAQGEKAEVYWMCHFGTELTGLEKWQLRKDHSDQLAATLQED